jgi:hypothetical protein
MQQQEQELLHGSSRKGTTSRYQQNRDGQPSGDSKNRNYFKVATEEEPLPGSSRTGTDNHQVAARTGTTSR